MPKKIENVVDVLVIAITVSAENSLVQLDVSFVGIRLIGTGVTALDGNAVLQSEALCLPQIRPGAQHKIVGSVDTLPDPNLVSLLCRH
jgi:hypothetical protein